MRNFVLAAAAALVLGSGVAAAAEGRAVANLKGIDVSTTEGAAIAKARIEAAAARACRNAQPIAGLRSPAAEAACRADAIKAVVEKIESPILAALLRQEEGVKVAAAQ